jgi:hypothetical protein
MMKDFHLGDILSVTTGKLVAPSGMDGVYAIMSYMTGTDLFTHQLPRAALPCALALLKQHPALGEIEAPEFAQPEDVPAWLAVQVAKYGEHLLVALLEPGAYLTKDPIQEMVEMRDGKPLIVAVDDRSEK